MLKNIQLYRNKLQKFSTNDTEEIKEILSEKKSKDDEINIKIDAFNYFTKNKIIAKIKKILYYYLR